jgi:hypothetical protein
MSLLWPSRCPLQAETGEGKVSDRCGISGIQAQNIMSAPPMRRRGE